jgi:hypothetical protein
MKFSTAEKRQWITIGGRRKQRGCRLFTCRRGASNEAFQYALELAAEAGVNFPGVLCGRATWKDGVAVFVEQGLTALEDWLHSEGARNIENVNKHLQAAQPWFGMTEESHLEKR